MSRRSRKAGASQSVSLFPFLSILACVIGTLTLMIAIAGAAFRSEWPVIRAHWKWLAVMGVVGFTGFNALFYISAVYTTAVNIGIIQGSIPVMVLAGAYLVYRTPVTGLQAMGIVVTATLKTSRPSTIGTASPFFSISSWVPG